MEMVFTGIFEDKGDHWIGYVEELPGANTQGATLDETSENLLEAIGLILQTNRELAEQQLAGKKFVRQELHVTV